LGAAQCCRLEEALDDTFAPGERVSTFRGRTMHLIIASVVVAIAACGNDSERTRQESAQTSCETYREHLLDVRLRGVTEDLDAHRVALRGSLGDDFIAQCESTLTEASFDCAMAATTSEQLRACDATSGNQP
jgi:hypothetical protein